MFKKKLGGIIQVDGEEDTLDTAAVEEPVAAEAANAPVSEDVWDSDEEKAAKRELQEQSSVIGKAAFPSPAWSTATSAARIRSASGARWWATSPPKASW